MKAQVLPLDSGTGSPGDGHPRLPSSVDDQATPCSRAPMTQQQFAMACEEHFNQVWRQMRAMGVADRFLDDATQEVFLIAHNKIDEFEGRAKLSTWFYAIAYRVGCNYRRKTLRDPIHEWNDEDELLDSGNPEQSLRDKQAAVFVQNFCDRLSEKLRDVFVLCLLEEQSAVDVAKLLGLPENTVYSRVRLAREAFRDALAAEEEPRR